MIWCPRARRARLALVAIAVTLCLCASAVRAADGPAFFGEFSTSDVIEADGLVTCTLTLRLTNQTGAALTAVAASLIDRGPLGTPFGAFQSFDAEDRVAVVVSGTFTVPSQEFGTWRSGGQPQVLLQFQAADGTAVSTRAALNPAVVPQGGR